MSKTEIEEVASIIIPKSLRNRLKVAASLTDTPMGDIAITALTQYLDLLKCQDQIDKIGDIWKKKISTK